MKIWSYKDKKTKRFVIVGRGGEKVLEFYCSCLLKGVW